MIEIRFRNQVAIINSLGGGIMKYYIEPHDVNSKPINIIYGYLDEAEKTGSMGDVLFPFPGRVENSQYNFEGNDYSLSGLRVKDGHAIHGFVKTLPWEMKKYDENAVTFGIELLKKDYVEKGFPFSLSLEISYTLGETGLICSAKVKNIGDSNAPFGLGFHPYFTVGNDFIDEAYLSLPAQKVVELKELKPTGRLIEIEKTEPNFAKLTKIGDKIIDGCFADLTFQSGIAVTEISNKKDQSIHVWQDENLPYLQIYSADTIADEHQRRGLAIEPLTCTGFALNKPEMGLKTLSPGETFECNWGIKGSN